MQKTDVMVTIDTERKLVIVRFGPDFTGAKMEMTPDEARDFAKLLLTSELALKAANAKPKSEEHPPEAKH